MKVRAYTADDAGSTSTIFLRAVRETSPVHYTPEQVAAWAADYGDLDSWAAARSAAHTLLAVVGGQVVGFSDLDDGGYIHMLFVDPDFGRQGVASGLLRSVVVMARERGLPVLTTFASLTSRPVFERQGFVVTGERYFGEGEGAAKTYAMRCVLDGRAGLAADPSGGEVQKPLPA